MQGLTLGKAVIYVEQLPEQVGTSEYVAVVSRDYSGHALYTVFQQMDADETDGMVSLHVLTENTVVVRYHIPYSAEKLPHTWHFIEQETSPAYHPDDAPNSACSAH